MAKVVNTYVPGLDGDAFTGVVTLTATSTQWTLGAPSGATTTYYGSGFTYKSGVIAGGTITGFEISLHGEVGYSMTGVHTPVVVFVTALAANVNPDTFFLQDNDEVFGSIVGEELHGWSGNDTIIALDGSDTVYGDGGNDDVNGNVGADLVHGGSGNDSVRGGKDNDTVFGDDGDDGHVNGNIGDDVVSGGNGNDTVYGGQGQDTLHGDVGNDVLAGDLGLDILFGDAGADRFVLRSGSQADWVADFKAAEGDRIQLTLGTAYTVSNVSGQAVIDIGHGDQLGLAGVAFASFSADWVVFA